MRREPTIGRNPLEALLSPEWGGTGEEPATHSTPSGGDEPGAQGGGGQGEREQRAATDRDRPQPTATDTPEARPGGSSSHESPPHKPHDDASPPLPASPQPPSQCLTFLLGGAEYAAGILAIREIVEYSPLTRVPTMPAWIHGVMNLRGSVVPVLDLALKFGLPSIVAGPRTCIVVVEVQLDGEETVLGLLVDAVNRVIDVDPESFEPVPSFGSQVRAEYLVGLVKDEAALVPILDLDRVVRSDELLGALEAGDGASTPEARDRAAGDTGATPGGVSPEEDP